MNKSNYEADVKNANKGIKGTNITYDKAQGNRGKQLNEEPRSKSVGARIEPRNR
jgi:hypothetical protein